MQELSLSHRISSYECGADGMLKPESYMLLCQEIAEEHAEKLGFGYAWGLEQGTLWVEARADIVFLQRPRWKDIVTLRTNTGKASALQARRFVEMSDGNGAILAKADLMWVLIDIKTRRPVPLKRAHLDLEEECPPTVSPFEEPAFLSPPAATSSVTALRRDVDFNAHVNNSSYLTWALDSLPIDRCPGKMPKRIQIQFKKESMPGEEMAIAHFIEGDASKHIITCKNQERAVVRIHWESGDRP